MSRLDRTFAEMRDAARKTPLTRADRFPEQFVSLPGGIAIALSINK